MAAPSPAAAAAAAAGGREIYTIPSSSAWFNWDEIHDTERRALPEFFDAAFGGGSTATRNARVYREYRDFIINKYREDPSRRLLFTDVRRTLVGDVSILRRVYLALDRWGLINFSAARPEDKAQSGAVRVVVESGPPAGSLRVVPAPPKRGADEGFRVVGQRGFKLPPLASYTDVFGEWVHGKGVPCGLCGQACDARRHVKGGIKVCLKCAKNDNEESGAGFVEARREAKESDEENRTFSVENTSETGVSGEENCTAAVESTRETKGSGEENCTAAAWSDAEQLSLLEGVLKHGDDWDLIAQNVGTRNKYECIARLIQMPFAEHMLGTINSKSNDRLLGSKPSDKRESQNPVEDSTPHGTMVKKDDFAVDKASEDRPSKKMRVSPPAGATDSLFKQVALLSTVAGAHIAAVSAEAAVAALSKENPHFMEFLNLDKEHPSHSPRSHFDQSKVCEGFNDLHGKEITDGHMEKPCNELTSSAAYRMRAAVGTAFGAAAARAKLLADHEEREMELLMSSIIAAQLRKMKHKMKHFEELESIMEQEYAFIQREKEAIIIEWRAVLQHMFGSGIPRSRDAPQPPPANMTAPQTAVGV